MTTALVLSAFPTFSNFAKVLTKSFSFLNCSGFTAEEESSRKRMYSSSSGWVANNETGEKVNILNHFMIYTCSLVIQYPLHTCYDLSDSILTSKLKLYAFLERHQGKYCSAVSFELLHFTKEFIGRLNSWINSTKAQYKAPMKVPLYRFHLNGHN